MIVSGLSGYIQARVIVFVQNACILAKVDVFGEICSFLAKVVVFWQGGCIWDKWL